MIKKHKQKHNFKLHDEVTFEGTFGIISGFLGTKEGLFIRMETLESSLDVKPDEIKKAPMCPWREAIASMVGKRPPLWCYDSTKLMQDDRISGLQDWIGMNLPSNLQWSTALGIIEAAKLLVKAAFDNGNIVMDADGNITWLAWPGNG